MENFYLSANEQEIISKYLKKGYLVHDISDKSNLELISNRIWETAKKCFPHELPNIPRDDFFNNIHQFLSVDLLNPFRVKILDSIASDATLRLAYFRIAKDILDIIVGNELAMQLRLNLSIQIPGDESSLLPVHADTWSGDSPFEVVIWLPLVNCYKSKSMYILPQNKKYAIDDAFANSGNTTSEMLFKYIESDIESIKINFGQLLIFNQGLPHGNRVNLESETRWSMNCRFKGVFTPYKDKKVGDFFEPITLRPASLNGIGYIYPEVKSET
jgi:sporadic carbohydrate cluster 2OG-Fe(II) oxygenase